ncbi:hypothetical protein MRX96_022562 [Rhipicephalus microplus]
MARPRKVLNPHDFAAPKNDRHITKVAEGYRENPDNAERSGRVETPPIAGVLRKCPNTTQTFAGAPPGYLYTWAPCVYGPCLVRRIGAIAIAAVTPLHCRVPGKQ